MDLVEEVEGGLEIGFGKGAGFDGQGQGVGVGWDGHGGDFDEFLLEIFARRLCGGLFPADRDEADRDAVEETAGIEGMGNFGDRVGICGELDALEEDVSAGDGADVGDEGFAKGEDDIAVLMGVLKYWVAAVGVEVPAGRGDGFAVAIEGGVGGDEIEAVLDF